MTSRWARPTVLAVLLLTSGCLGGLFGAERPTTDDARVDLYAAPVAPVGNDASGFPTEVAPTETPSPQPSVTPTATPTPVDWDSHATVGDSETVAETIETNSTDVGDVILVRIPTVDASPPSVPVVGAPTRPASESVVEEVTSPAPTPSTPVSTPDASDTTDQTNQSNTTESVTRSGTVVGIVDGDTVRVQFADDELATVDLAGVDAPELYTSTNPVLFSPVPNSTGGETYLHVWGWTADRALIRELSGESVEVELVSSSTVDASDDPDVVFESPETVYVAYVVHEGRSVNLALLASGLARATANEHPQRETFVAAETDARANERGLWGVTDPLSVP